MLYVAGWPHLVLVSCWIPAQKRKVWVRLWRRWHTRLWQEYFYHYNMVPWSQKEPRTLQMRLYPPSERLSQRHGLHVNMAGLEASTSSTVLQGFTALCVAKFTCKSDDAFGAMQRAPRGKRCGEAKPHHAAVSRYSPVPDYLHASSYPMNEPTLLRHRHFDESKMLFTETALRCVNEHTSTLHNFWCAFSSDEARHQRPQ